MRYLIVLAGMFSDGVNILTLRTAKHARARQSPARFMAYALAAAVLAVVARRDWPQLGLAGAGIIAASVSVLLPWLAVQGEAAMEIAYDVAAVCVTAGASYLLVPAGSPLELVLAIWLAIAWAVYSLRFVRRPVNRD